MSIALTFVPLATSTSSCINRIKHCNWKRQLWKQKLQCSGHWNQIPHTKLKNTMRSENIVCHEVMEVTKDYKQARTINLLKNQVSH